MSLIARVIRNLASRHRGRPRPPFDEPKRFGGRGKDAPDAGGVPVSPDRPRDLSGGAAAAIEADD